MVFKVETVQVDPLKQVEIKVRTDDGIQTVKKVFGYIPKLVAEPWANMQVSAIPEEYKSLSGLFRGEKALEDEFLPLPIDRVEHHPSGIRTIAGVTSHVPNKIITISGLGIVQSEKGDGSTTLRLRAPEFDTPLSNCREMGTMRTDSEGTVWQVVNHSPFGTYQRADLDTKVEMTRTLGDPRVEVIVSAKYGSKDAGGLIYALPATVLRPEELIELDVQLPEQHRGELYGEMMYALMGKLRGNHEENIVHLQVHPGNWFGYYDGNMPNPVINDWETATDINQLPAPETYNTKGYTVEEVARRAFRRLSPGQKAIGIDLEVALCSALIIDSKEFRDPRLKDFPIELSYYDVSEEVVDYQLLALSYSMAGYFRQPVETVPEIMLNIKNMYAALAIEAYNKTAVQISKDLVVSTFEDLLNAERAQFALRSTIKEIKVRFAGMMGEMQYGDSTLNQFMEEGGRLDQYKYY